MARWKGLEPLAYCLEGSCSIQLSYQRTMERVMGIEPTRPAWKAGILPLNYTRMGAERQPKYDSTPWLHLSMVFFPTFSEIGFILKNSRIIHNGAACLI